MNGIVFDGVGRMSLEIHNRCLYQVCSWSLWGKVSVETWVTNIIR